MAVLQNAMAPFCIYTFKLSLLLFFLDQSFKFNIYLYSKIPIPLSLPF